MVYFVFVSFTCIISTNIFALNYYSISIPIGSWVAVVSKISHKSWTSSNIADSIDVRAKPKDTVYILGQ